MGLASKLPPPALSARIGGSEEAYHAIGRAHADLLASMLPEDWTWKGKRVLDFGCGTGRTLVKFADEAEEAEFVGCDIDEPSIEWATRNLSPPFRFVRNEELPPIALPAESFDLIYGMSVFTHLVDTWSDWLLEMHRLLKVGGYGVFTFLGEGMIQEVAGRDWDEDRIGMIGLDVGRPWSVGGPNALHSKWWLRAHWGRLFEVETVMPYADRVNRHGHGAIRIRKDERPTPSRGDLLAPEAAEPREEASLRFNLELVQERAAMLWARSSDGADHPPSEPCVGWSVSAERLSSVKGNVRQALRRHVPVPVKRTVRAMLRPKETPDETPREPWPPSIGGDTWFHDHFDEAADSIAKFLGGDGISLDGLSVADIGTGDGIIALGVALKRTPARLVGFDIKAVDRGWLAEQARIHNVADELPENLEFRQSDVTTIPAEDNSFDVVLSWSAFEHVADAPALLREIRRILRPGGTLFVQLWPFYYSEHGGHLWEWYRDNLAFAALRNSPEDVAAAMRTNPQGDPDWAEERLRNFLELNRMTLDDLQQALLSAGFHIGKVELLSTAFHLPPGLDRDFALSDLAIAGVKLLAAAPP